MGPGDTSTVVLKVLEGSRFASITLERRPDLAMVNELALVKLAASRLGLTVRLSDPCPRLAELIDLVGLADLLGGPTGSAAEAGGEPEGGEELRIEEMVEAGDPPG